MMEAEYITLSTAMCSLVQLCALLFELDELFSLSLASTVFEDNRACCILANTDPPRSKSPAIKYHWFCTHMSENMIIIKDIASADQKGNGFTKTLVYKKFSSSIVLFAAGNLGEGE